MAGPSSDISTHIPVLLLKLVTLVSVMSFSLAHNFSYSPNFRVKWAYENNIFKFRQISDSGYDYGVVQVLLTNIMFSDIFEIIGEFCRF